MSRFSDFDDFLKRQEKAADDALLKLQQSRDEHDLLIRELFRVFQEYHDKIIKPRKDYFVIAKKKEAFPQSQRLRTGLSPYYLYRINLVPKDTLPLSVTPLTATNSEFLRPRKITKGDWHPYVAMQFDVALHDTIVEEKLTPSIVLRIWGDLDVGQKPIEHPIVVAVEQTALTKTTVITIPYEPERPDALVDRTSRVLMMITPSILK